MPEFSQSRDEHARQKELFEESYSRKHIFNREEIQPVGLAVCHSKEINLYKKWQQHRESCSQGLHYTVGDTRGHIKRLKSKSIQSVRFTLSTKKRQPEIIHHKSKNKVITKWLQKAAEMEFLRHQSFMPSSTVTPRFSTTDSSNLLGIFTPIRSCESYFVNPFPMYSVTDSDKPYSISGTRSLSFHDNYTIKTAQPNTTYKLVSQVSTINNSFLDLHLDQNFHQVPISYMDNKRRYKQQKLQKKKLHRKPNSISDFVIQSPYDKVRQTHTRRLPAPETNGTPYAKTVIVYTVFNQKLTKTQPRNTLGSNASFNIKFYRRMTGGDGRQMSGNNAPCVPIPRNYSPTNMARMGRDEDGCICMYIPQQPGYERFRMGNGNTCECEGFLKRYFRTLLTEQKRCCRARSKPKPYKYASNSTAGSNFHGNDVSCQCRCKERQEHRPDRDIFCKNRGTTCCVPNCPGLQSNPTSPVCNTANYPNGQTKGMPDKDAVNIGSNFSFQVGLYKRCLDNQPAPARYSKPNPNNYYSFNNNIPAYDPYMQSVQPYMQSVQPCIDDCSFSCSDASSYREPKSASLFSVLLRSRAPKLEVKCSSTQRPGLGGGMQRPGLGGGMQRPGLGGDMQGPGQIDCCTQSQSSSWSQFIKSQFERNDLCCNNLPMSHCKPKKTKAVRCRCSKKPKLVGCTDQQSSVGIICSRRTSDQSASTGLKSKNVKHSGCNCQPESYLAPCKKKLKDICSKCCRSKCCRSKCCRSKCCRSKCCRSKCCRSKCCISKCCRKKSSKCGSKKCCECCCKKCSKCCVKKRASKRARGKKCRCKKQPSIFKICRTLSTLLQEQSGDGCCRCKTSDAKNKYDAKNDTRCCCTQTKLRSIVRPMSMLLQKIGKRCNLAKKSSNNKCKCKCSNNSGEFDYKKVEERIKVSEKAKAKRCLCGDTIMKKFYSSQLVVPEPPPKLTKAQQCGCIEGANKKRKMFGRLLLYNTIPPRPICCSRVTYDENSRTVGTGEDDYRKVPPCRRARVPDGSQGDGLNLKRLVSILINPEKCCTRMHYTAFNPRNQCEAGIQHIGRVGPDERAGRETVCKNQGVECPRSKPLTMKDCETACPAFASQKDSDRRAVRLGSNCSFCLEFYKGAPPPKNVSTCPASRSAPPAPPPRYVPYAETPTKSAIPVGGNNCCPTKTPCPARDPKKIIKKALTYFMAQKKCKPRKKCQKCNKCVEPPLIKRGLAHVILKNTKPVKKSIPHSCQKTNTLQPTRKLLFGSPAAGGKGRLGKSSNCDPYVCLKRINQRECCNAK